MRRSSHTPVALSLALALLVAPSAARAQSQAAIGLGLAVSSVAPVSDEAIGSSSIGPLLRFNTGPGFGYAIGFNWFTTQATRRFDGVIVPVARVRTRPVMAGVAYRLQRRNLTTELSAMAGFAFNSLRTTGAGRRAYQAEGVSRFDMSAEDGLAWRVRVALWYDFTPRVGFMTSLAYLAAEPTINFETSAGRESWRHRASSTVLTFGVVYGVF